MADATVVVVPHRNQQTLFLLGQLNSVVEGLLLTPAHDAQIINLIWNQLLDTVRRERQKLRQCVDANILVNGFDENMLASPF